ncbi:MAG: sensor domain-containing protein [Mycobacterium sp.]
MWRVLVIAAAVVGLTCACSTTVDGTPRAQRTQVPAATPAAPDVAAVGEQQLDGLLLPLDDVRTIMDAPELEVHDTYAQMPPSTVGYVPEDCARAAFNTVEAGYRDSKFIATRGAVMQEPDTSTQLLHIVDQGVVTFPDEAAANTYVTRTVEAWRRCAGTPFTVLRPEATEHWTFGDVTENNGISAIPKKTDGSDWTCSHAIAARANAVVDVSACGFSVTDQATTIVGRIRDKFPA